MYGHAFRPRRIEDYTMVFTGEDSYVHGERELLDFTEIRRLVSNMESVQNKV